MKKTKKNDRRILAAALVVAGVTVAGSTFAWFSSKDEVTNRLTASANYGVSIVEDFTPPEDLTPGQTVNKDVSAVNTGSVDAFVRMGIENMLQITVPGTQDIDISATSATTAPYTDYTFSFTDPTLTNAIELSTVKTQNADGTLSADEVTTLQAGGELVVAANKSVRVDDQAIRSGVYTDSGEKIGEYDANGKFKPDATKPGLYLFRRTVTEGNGNNVTKYSGYYFDGEHYYALATEGNTAYVDATITETAQGSGSVVSAISGLKLKTKEDKTQADTAGDITMSFVKLSGTTYTEVASGSESTATHIKAIYDPDNTGTSDDVVFYIKLADDWATNWTYVAKDITPTDDATTPAAIGKGIGYFYYNDDLEAGATSARLVDSVKMDESVTQSAYIDLTYDINVILDSVQVTKNSNNLETTESAASQWGSDVIIAEQVADELSNLAWS